MNQMTNNREFREFIQDALAEHMYTEDMPRLLMKDFHYVFIYNHRRGKSSNYLIAEDGAEFISFAWTNSKIYEILKVETERKTYHLASVLGNDHLFGELWLLPTELVLNLDYDESNTLITRRFETSIALPTGKIVPAWIYVGNNKWLDRHKNQTTKQTAATYYGTKRFIEVL